MQAAFTSPTAIAIGASHGFSAWLRRRRVAVAYAARETGRIGVVSLDAAGAFASREQRLPGCAALLATADRRALLCAAEDGLVRLTPSPDVSPLDADAPPRSRVSGRWDGTATVDLALLGDGRPILADARRGLVAVSPSGAIDVIWRPTTSDPEVTVTGVAVDEDGTAAFATAMRDASGRSEGLVIDLASGEIALTGLGRVHTPRLQNGWLWMLEAGRDELCVADPDSGLCERVAACPGRARGLVLDGAQALVGISPSPALRMPLPHGPQRFCGFALIDTHSGIVSEWLDLGDGVEAVDDVSLLSTRPRTGAARSAMSPSAETETCSSP